MPGQPTRPKSKLSKALVDLRTAYGESQQAFSNRLELALNTVARYETSRTPSGHILLRFEQLAGDVNRHDLATIFRSAYEDGLLNKGIRRPAFTGSLLDHFASKLQRLERIIESGPEHPTRKEAAELLNQLWKETNWPQLVAIRHVLTYMEELSESGNPLSLAEAKDVTSKFKSAKRIVEKIRHTLEAELPAWGFADGDQEGTK